MSDDIRIKKAVYESVKDMFALAVSGSRFKLKSTSYEVQNAKTKIDFTIQLKYYVLVTMLCYL